MTDKPVPSITPTSEPFWSAAAKGFLAYQHCMDCGNAQYYPRMLCSKCGSRRIDWKKSIGKAVVHATTRVHVGLHSFKAEAPYDIVLIDVEEGFRMLVNVINNPDDVVIGDQGRVVFVSRDGVSFPQFKRDESEFA